MYVRMYAMNTSWEVRKKKAIAHYQNLAVAPTTYKSSASQDPLLAQGLPM